MRPALAAILFVLPLFAGLLQGCAVTPPAAQLSRADQADVRRAETYLNTLQTIRARFIQERGNEMASGQLWVSRPGQMQMQYDPPSQAMLKVAAGRVTFSDAATGAVSTIPLDRTPLSMLLAQQIVFSGPVTIMDVRRAAETLDITLRRTENPRQGLLTLQFTQNPLQLRGLVMVDARGTVTRLLLRDLQPRQQAPGA